MKEGSGRFASTQLCAFTRFDSARYVSVRSGSRFAILQFHNYQSEDSNRAIAPIVSIKQTDKMYLFLHMTVTILKSVGAIMARGSSTNLDLNVDRLERRPSATWPTRRAAAARFVSGPTNPETQPT